MVELNIEVPESFFEEEEICGYLVTKKMKEVWAIELDILYKLQQVCEKHGLLYMGSEGTLLGAIRHGGFIPWDDDIDLDMPRNDYNKLCEIAQDEFKYPYFFQTEYTDKGSMRGHIQIRRTDTTGILQGEKDTWNFNQGIFIDVFPIDNLPDEKEKLDKIINKVILYKKVSMIVRNISNLKAIKRNSRKKMLKYFVWPFFIVLNKFNVDTMIYRRMELEAQKYKDEKTFMVGGITLLPKSDELRYPSEYFDNMISVPFEFININITKMYDDVLTKKYGNYSEFVLGGSMHGEVIFNTDKSYLDYFEKK